MRIAYLDCFSGISGDMFLGALLDAGVPFELFQKTVADLNIGATLELSRVDRAGISATKLDVVVNGEKDMPREEFWADRHGAADRDSHEHDRHHERQLECNPAYHRRCSRQRACEAHRERDLPCTGRSGSEDPQRRRRRRSLSRGRAPPTRLWTLFAPPSAQKRSELSSSSLRRSTLAAEQSLVRTAFCRFPPRPLSSCLQGAPIYSGDIQKELVTPTGAAIVKVLVSSFGPRPMMTTEKIAYGAGARDFSGHPNVLR